MVIVLFVADMRKDEQVDAVRFSMLERLEFKSETHDILLNLCSWPSVSERDGPKCQLLLPRPWPTYRKA